MKHLLAPLALLVAACGATPPPPPAPAPAGPSAAEVATDLLGCDYLNGDAPETVAKHTLPPTPCWTNKYVDRIDENVRYFHLPGLMTEYGLTSLQAVELQNHYRDIMRATPDGDEAAAFQTALDRVKKGEFESGVDPEAMARAKFIVVFDLDETFYDQRTGDAECNDAAFEYESRGETKTKYVKMVPGWQAAVARIAELGGVTVLFSANLDARTLLNLSKVNLDGVPLTESPKIAGIMTNSFLTQQTKTAPPGSAETPWKGKPVFEPSKDLRHFDPDLKKVLLVDDNPLRFFQFRNTRTFQKFHADKLCGAEDPELRAAYENMLPAMIAEVEESVAWMGGGEGRDFVTAYLPYSDLGQVAHRFLMQTRAWSAEKARDYIRSNPGVVSPKF